MITTGDTVVLRASHLRYVVRNELGHGAQGTVHRVEPVDSGRALALKWYRPDSANRAQAERIRRALELGAPSPAFLWPLEFATDAERRPGWGYVMRLCSDSYVPAGRVVNGAVTMRLQPLVVAALRMARAFRDLHTTGLCYADINLSNVFLHPESGHIEICDNDNVTVDGMPSAVIGTPYFMAPELVRRQASPTIATDRHALAVMLFFLLVHSHPLVGSRPTVTGQLDDQALDAMLGTEPLFIFDPVSVMNRPDPERHHNAVVMWPALPRFLRALFERAFTDGLRDPEHARVTESEWIGALRRLTGLVRRCELCGSEQFFDPERAEGPCANPTCAAALTAPPLLTTPGGRLLVLQDDVTITERDLAPSSAAEPGEIPIARIVRHPRDGRLAIRNLSAVPWSVTRPSGTSTLAPRSAILLQSDLRLTIGTRHATVRIGG